MYIIILILVISIIIGIVVHFKQSSDSYRGKKANSLLIIIITFSILFFATWTISGYIAKMDSIYKVIAYNKEEFKPFNCNDTVNIYVNVDSDEFTYYKNDRTQLYNAPISEIKYHNQNVFIHYVIIKRCNSKWLILISRNKLINEYHIPKTTSIIKR